jgi:hypothetical protein
MFTPAGDGINHEIRRIADVGVGAHDHRAERNRRQGRQKPLATMARIAMPISPIFTWPLTRSFTAPSRRAEGFLHAGQIRIDQKENRKQNTGREAWGHKARVVQKKSIP